MAQLTIQQAFDLALQHHQAGRLREAEQIYRKILANQPNNADAMHLLGVLANQMGRPDAAIELIRRTIALHPQFADAHLNLGNALKDNGQVDEAITAYRQAIAIKPDFADAYTNLSVVLKEKGQLDEATAAAKSATSFNPNSPEAHNNLGNALKDVGLVSEAIASYRRAIALRPSYAQAHSNLVYLLHFSPDFDAQAVREEASRWNQQHAAPLEQSIRPHGNDRDPERPLRIGYISPDFRAHPLAHNFLPLAIGHDPTHYRMICYSAVRKPDAMTQRLRTLADEWRDVPALSDEQLAQLIRRDKIDILIDLAEHTANNRLLVFARKPAPVQATCLCNIGTTGLPTIDYRVTDPYSDPPGTSQANYVEQIVLLPDCYFCHEVPRESPPGNASPVTQTGQITFGSLNNFTKVTPQALRCWSQILLALPKSRLILRCPSGSAQERVRTLFAEQGITADRIELLDRRLAPDEYLCLHHRIDIYLDPFPYSGHTTSMDALWMGVPLITLAGRTDVGRSGVFLLSNLKMQELIAQTEEAYVQKAVQLASDLNRLTAYRASLRQLMLESPLLDVPRFAGNMEAAFRTMWRRWCQSTDRVPSGSSEMG
jgi:predicted O-linked N-acetylglucosamine transferase (SPINDLY family)